MPHLLQTLAPLAIAGGHIDANGRPLINKVYSNGDLQLVSNAVLAACDSLDGLLDGIANNIDACTDAVVMPKLTALTCTAGKNDSCLSGAQITAFQKAMAGPKTSTGIQVYSGHSWDPGIGGMNGTTFNSEFRNFWFGAYDSPTNTAAAAPRSAWCHTPAATATARIASTSRASAGSSARPNAWCPGRTSSSPSLCRPSCAIWPATTRAWSTPS